LVWFGFGLPWLLAWLGFKLGLACGFPWIGFSLDYLGFWLGLVSDLAWQLASFGLAFDLFLGLAWVLA